MVVPAYAWEAASPAPVEAFGLPAVASRKASRVDLREYWKGHAAYPVPSAVAYHVIRSAWEVAGLPAVYVETEGIAVLSWAPAAYPAVIVGGKVVPYPVETAAGMMEVSRVEAGIVEP